MSCKYCSAIGDEKTFLDRPERWFSSSEWSKEVAKMRQKENMAREEIPEIIDKEMSPFNDAQMLNGTFEGDTISRIAKRGRMARRRLEKLQEKEV